MENKELKNEVIKVLKTSAIKDVIAAIITKELKDNKALNKQVNELTNDVLAKLFRTLANKKDFWQITI